MAAFCKLPILCSQLFFLKYLILNLRYEDFVDYFHAELFDPDEWADLIAASGAKYYVFTAKFHEGYAMFPSPYSWNWNSVDTGSSYF